MIIKHLTQAGNPIIRKKAKKVVGIRGKKTQQIIKNLVASMRHHSLVGLAAPQIGSSIRVFISEIRTTKLRKSTKGGGDSLRVYINPKITWSSEKKALGYEGCGSVANGILFGLVQRPKGVMVEAYDQKGKKFILKASNLLARIIQHENDHLNGVLFTDTALPKSYMSRDEYLKMAR